MDDRHLAGIALEALEDVQRLNAENSNLRAIVATRQNHIAALEARLVAAVGALAEVRVQLEDWLVACEDCAGEGEDCPTCEPVQVMLAKVQAGMEEGRE